MLKITKAGQSPELEAFCKENGVAWGQELEYYAATCGKIVGCCAFAIAGDRLAIHGAAALEEFGPALCDGLVRAVYQYALREGAKTADFTPDFAQNLWSALVAFGHTHKTDNDIDNFLTNCKNCAR